ncbi:MAG: DUF3943 domain-containing protein [Treponema sp.]|jgi:hypothetical protein|nr:DUF3943 domain-containing protein [Treponema sp.]
MCTSKKILVLFFIFSLCFVPVKLAAGDTLEASSENLQVTPVSPADENPQKQYLAAVSGVAFENISIFLWNKYMIGAGWTQVTPDDWIHFYKRDLEFDTDWYWTNFVLHPYQGALAYMMGRASNLNQLESFGLAVLESVTWEFFCETNDPSINDLVYSTIGAFPVGEMLYRLSFETEPYGSCWNWLVSPSRPYISTLTHTKAPGTFGNIYDLSLAFAIGAAGVRTDYYYGKECSDNRLYPAFGKSVFRVIYNDPYGRDSDVPYSQFDLKVSGAVGAGSNKGAGVQKSAFYDVEILSNGFLFSRALDWGSGDRATTVGLVLDYDFIMHSFIELSSLAAGGAIKQKITTGSGSFAWQFHFDGVILGTSDYYYFYDDIFPKVSSTRREYNYTTGAEWVLGIDWVNGRNRVLLDAHLYGMYVFPYQVQTLDDGRSGWELCCPVDCSAEHYLTERISLGLGGRLYLKKGWYSGDADVSQIGGSINVFTRLRPGL